MGAEDIFKTWPGANVEPWPFIPLDQVDEPKFHNWYRDYASKTGLAPNPDDPLHQYNYRAWWRALQAFPDKYGAQVDPADGRLHAPSLFKRYDHPTRYQYEGGNLFDSIINEVLIGLARQPK